MLVTVLIPVLDRPERVEPLLASLAASQGDARLQPVFLCTPQDLREIAAIERAGVEPRVVAWRAGSGDYARKMNLGLREADTEWVFLAADDLRFHPDWADEALAVAAQRDCCVIGTNDLGNQRTVAGIHSTHSLVHRDYRACGSVDDPDRPLHEGYWHNFVDDEFVQTAIWRSTFAHAKRSIVEHLHPHWGKGQLDETYRKGLKDFGADRAHYNERRHLWNGPAR